MRKSLVFNQKTGQLAVRSVQREQWKETGSNVKIELLDPISFKITGLGEVNFDWKPLPRDNALRQMFEVFDIIYNANWYFNCTRGEIEEYLILNEHEVFEKIREIMK